METAREVIRWAWLLITIANFVSSLLAWAELKGKRDRSFVYLSRWMRADAARAVVTGLGLYLFGINVQSKLWFLALGLASVAYQSYATVGWLLYVRGLINGGGWFELLHRTKLPKISKKNKRKS